MVMDLLALLQRDHEDLERGLDELVEPWLSVAQLRTTLDGVRLGLTAHAEAEDIVLYRVTREFPELERMVCDGRAAHLAQESALAALVCAVPGTADWVDRAVHLRELVQVHARFEEGHLVPAIREIAADLYSKLAGAFATERLRQLAQLQPSVPLCIGDITRLEARAS